MKKEKLPKIDTVKKQVDVMVKIISKQVITKETPAKLDKRCKEVNKKRDKMAINRQLVIKLSNVSFQRLPNGTFQKNKVSRAIDVKRYPAIWLEERLNWPHPIYNGSLIGYLPLLTNSMDKKLNINWFLPEARDIPGHIQTKVIESLRYYLFLIIFSMKNIRY